MEEGYILSNKFRRAIFDGFASGENDLNIIVKKHRIIFTVGKRIAEDLIKGGVLEKKGNKYILTKEGERLAKIIRG
ncbi:MAG: hypothetical protein AYK22_06940 [Thermoplasmatales archaeon SG8-52-3]|nr:MAG: hypothetical protein AYK22_06940 [Thermoplasmatales archaeon SG8-52-3]